MNNCITRSQNKKISEKQVFKQNWGQAAWKSRKYIFLRTQRWTQISWLGHFSWIFILFMNQITYYLWVIILKYIGDCQRIQSESTSVCEEKFFFYIFMPLGLSFVWKLVFYLVFIVVFWNDKMDKFFIWPAKLLWICNCSWRVAQYRK